MKIRPGGVVPATLVIKPPKGSVPPGFYVAASDSPAYTKLRAAEESGQVRLVGERYTEDQYGLNKVTTGLLPHAMTHGLRVAANPSIGIGREFFVSALKDYRDWKIKWWREVVQNAVDAGATQVDLEAVQLEDGTWAVSCTDNGGGMTEDVLLNKFLVLGGTTKEGASGTAGGFGKAKELILLPWLEWQVWTRGVVAVGAGIDYEVRPADRHRAGTKLWVRMPPDEYTGPSHAIAFVEKCWLPGVKTRVNGKAYRGKLKSDKLIDKVDDKAEVYHVQKKGETGQGIMVRANGLFMFRVGHHQVEGGHLIAELTAPSIEILTANRDGFRDWRVRNAIDSLAERVAVDVKSALRAKKGLVRKKYVGAGKFQAAKMRETAALERMGSLVPTKSGRMDIQAINSILEVIVTRAGLERMEAVDSLHEQVEQASPQEDAVVHSITSPEAGTSAAIMRSVTLLGVNHAENAVKQLVWEPDFYVYNNVEGWRPQKRFYPESMSPKLNKLARVWTELCRYVLIQLNCSLPFGVGWIFQEETGAAYQGEDENESYFFKAGGEHWLLLNPFKSTNPRRAGFWSPTKTADLKRLYAYAIHEATHMADGIVMHNESFASALTENMARCADGFKHARKIAREVKMKGKARADR